MRGRQLLRLAGLVRQGLRDLGERGDESGDSYRRRGATIGPDCRLIDCDFGSEPYLVTLGRHVSATGTSFITHDGGVWVFREEWPEADVFGPIVVGDNVFFGTGTLVLPGVTIGDNVVIGAGSVVAGDVPSNCVAAGTPAKPISDLEQYRSGLAERVLSTKGLDPESKAAVLKQHFARTDDLDGS